MLVLSQQYYYKDLSDKDIKESIENLSDRYYSRLEYQLKHHSCYFHGELEDEMGYDIVKVIGSTQRYGKRCRIKDGDVIEVLSVPPKKYHKNTLNCSLGIKSYMIVGRYDESPHLYTDNYGRLIREEYRLYILVVNEKDKKKFLSGDKDIIGVGAGHRRYFKELFTQLNIKV